eukprot:Hpha_TRINITY_DN15403_c0_g1::TRINITY_DN15403_c0_g1_i1::g.175716::m.175716
MGSRRLLPLVAALHVAAGAVTVTKSDFVESTAMLGNNPVRGMYLPIDIAADILSRTTAADFSLDGEEMSLVRFLVTLENSCDSADISAQLGEISSVLTHLKTLGKRALFRFFYTPRDGTKNTCGHYYPNSVAVATDHIARIGALVNTMPEAIGFVEAGVIGPWGEWHGWGADGFIDSTVLSDKVSRTAISEALRAAFAPIPVLLRRPVFKIEADDPDAFGMHNDCFLTSWNPPSEIDQYTFSADYGGYTYGYADAQALFNYAVGVSDTVPMGGETCAVTSGTRFTCAEAVPEFKQLRYDYINQGFYVPATDGWRTGGCFDEIRRYIGYRFHVQSVGYATDLSPQESSTLQF